MKKLLFFLMTLMLLCLSVAVKAQSPVLYEENFDGMSSESDLTAAGWISYGASGCYIGINTSYSTSGSNSLLISAWDGNNNSDSEVAGLPVLSEPINTLQITLSYRQRTGGIVRVGYLTDPDDASTFVSLQNLSSSTSAFNTVTVDLSNAPANAARIAIQQYTWYDCYIDDIEVKALPTCMKPQNLAVTLTPGNGSVATLTWQRHANGTEDAWVLEYCTNPNFTDATSVNVTGGTPSKELTTLTAETKYYARVKADCGGDYSDWGNPISFTPTDAYTLPLNEGSSTSSYVPFYYYVGSYTTIASQFIIPAADLASIQWATINKLTFYNSLATVSYGSANFTVYAGEVNTTTQSSSFTDWASLTAVYTGTVSVSDNEMVITFDQPFQYTTGNLLIGFKINSTGTSASYNTTWKGVSAPSGASVYSSSSSSVSTAPFLPQVTINYTPGEAPSCLPVSNLSNNPEDNTTTSVVLTWTDNNNGNATYVITDGTDNPILEGQISNLTSTGVTIGGLLANTAYTFKVKANCGNDEYSDPVTISNVKTACGSIVVDADHSFSEDFEFISGTGHGVLPDCWKQLVEGTSSSNYLGVYSSNVHDGSKCLRFYYSQSTGNYAMLPQFENLNTLRMKFWHKSENATVSNCGTLYVGYITDPDDLSTFVPLKEIETSNATTSYSEETVNFASAPANARIVFKHVASGTYWYWHIDDILIEPIPSCMEPSGLSVDANSITTSSVQLQWTPAENTTAWDIYYTTDPSDVPTASTIPSVTGTTDNPCLVGNLTHSSHYYAYVRTHCANEQSPWTTATEFDTKCEPFTISENVKYQEGFEDYTGTTYDANGVIPICWANSYSSTASVTPHVIGSGSYYYVHDGTKALTFYGSNYNYVSLPEFSNNLSDLQISFWMRCENSSYGTLTLGYITSEDNGTYNTFTPVPNVTIANSSSMVERGPYYLTNVPNEATRLVFRWYYSGQYSCCIDDIEVSLIPSCLPLSGNPTTTATTAHTATLNWNVTDDNQTQWQIAYKPGANFDPTDAAALESATIETANEKPYTISDLNQSQEYYAYVRAICGNDYSTWAGPVTFTTLAGNVTPSGLAVAANTITSSQATASWNAVAGNTLHQSYDIYWAASDVASVPDEPAAPNLISGITTTSQLLSSLNAETEYKVWVRDNCGSDGYSTWAGPVNFTTASSCQTPDGLDKNNVTANSATIIWNTYGQTDFNLRYGTDGENWTTIENVGTSHTFSNNLTGNTTYYVQVQASCNTAEAWSSTLNFTTPCDAITIDDEHHYRQAFELPVTTATYNSTTGLVVPDCWIPYYTNSSNSYVLPHIIKSDAGSSYNFSNPLSQVLFFYGKDGYVALPEFANAINTLQISFKWAVENKSYGTLKLGYITADDNGSFNTFQSIKELAANTATTAKTMEDIVLYLNNVPNTATRLVFLWTGTSNYYCNIDDVEISLAPTCFPVNTLSYDPQSVTTNAATISWTLIDNGQDNWDVQYATNEGFTQGINLIENVNSHENYALTLNPNTHYYVRVRANCGNDGTGDWSNVINFQTENPCTAPTALEASEDQTNQSVLSWTPGANETAWKLYWKKASDENYTEVTENVTNPYTLPDLDAATEYMFYVKAICGEELSDASDIKSFTTACPATFPLPLSENFDSFTGTSYASNTAIHPCWTKGSTYSTSEFYPHVYTTNKNSSPNSLRFISQYYYANSYEYSSWVALPKLEPSSTGIVVTFQLGANTTYSSEANMQVGLMKLDEGISSFVAHETFTPSSTSTFTECTVEFPNSIGDSVLAFYVPVPTSSTSSVHYMYLDDITVSAIPACRPVTEISFSNVERTSMTVAWTKHASATNNNFQLVYSTAELDNAALEAADKIDVEGTSHNLTGLERNTLYYIYVRGNCGNDGYSEWVSATQRTQGLGADCTNSEEMTLLTGNGTSDNINYVPLYTNYGGEYAIQIYTAAELTEMGLTADSYISSIAFHLKTIGDNTTENKYTKNSSVWMANTEKNTFTSSTDWMTSGLTQVKNPAAIAFTPADSWIEIPLDNTFQWDGTSNLAVATLFVSTGSYTTHTFYGKALTEYRTIYYRADGTSLTVNNGIPSGGSSTSSTNYTQRADIKFTVCEEAAACPAVTNLHEEDVTTESATISWIASTGDYVGSYELYYSTEEVTEFDAITPQYTITQGTEQPLTSLTENTTYYVYVKTVCDANNHDDGVSEWAHLQFTTTANCVAPVNVAATLTAKNAANVTWEDGDNDTENNNFQYILSTSQITDFSGIVPTEVMGAATEKSLTGLEYATDYYFYVANNCGNSTSDYALTTFTTAAECPAVQNLQAGTPGANTVALTWEPGQFGEETSWTVSVNETNLSWTSDETAFTVFGLTATTSYTIQVTANCSATLLSTPATVDVTTAAASGDCKLVNGTDNTSYAPVYGSWTDNAQKTQSIYPASKLTELQGKTITELKYFVYNGSSSGSNGSWEDETFLIKMAITEQENLSSSWANEEMTTVYTGTLSASTTDDMSIPLSTPFTYNGGNLLIEFEMPASLGGYSSCNFYALSSTGGSRYAYGSSYATATGTSISYLPKVEFCCTPSACPSVRNLAVGEITTNSAKISWQPGSNESQWLYYYEDNEVALTDEELDAVVAQSYNAGLSIELPQLTSNTHYFFYIKPNAGNDCSWQHVDFTTDATCLPPTVNTVVEETVTSESATISWTPNSSSAHSALSWSLRYRIVGSTAWTTEDNIASTAESHPLNNLSSQSTYEVQVMAVCGDNDESEWSNTVTFTTKCGSVTEFPWNENFNSLSTNGQIPVCWNNDDGTTTDNNYKWCYYSGTGSGGTTGTGVNNTNCIRFNSYSNTDGKTNFLKTPVFNFPASTIMQLSFWYKNPAGGDFSVYISTDGGETYTNELASGLTGQSSWKEKKILLNDYTNEQNVVIVFKGTSNFEYNDAYIYLDSVVVKEAPACEAPTIAANATNVGANTATVSWTAGGENQTHWDIYYSTDNTAPDANTTPNVTFTDENPYTLTQLDPQTTYYAWVRGNCGTENEPEYTEWSGSLSFITDCEPFVVTEQTPFTEGFEDALVPPECWKSVPDGNLVWDINGQTHHESDYSAHAEYSSNFIEMWMISRAITLPAEDETQLIFWSFNYYPDDYGKNRVFISTNGSDISNFTTETEVWSPDNVSESWVSDTVPLTAYAGQTIYIAFKYEGENAHDWYLDDITVKVKPACEAPSTPVVETVTATTATLAWVDNNNATEWNIQYKETSANDWTVENTTENPYTITNLTQGHEYEAQVQAICGENPSNWSSSVTFVPEPTCFSWSLITDANDFSVGDEVCLVYESGNTKKELSGFNGTSTVYGTGADYDDVPAGLYRLTVVAGKTSGSYAFKNGDNYLYWNSGNSLQTSTSLTNNSSWNVSFTNGNAVLANANTSARTIRWNSGSPRFACYENGQAAVSLYKLIDHRGTSDTIANVIADSYTWRGIECPASGDYEYVMTGAAANGCDSVRVLHLTLQHKVATPVINPVADTYTEPVNVTITCETEGATIYYTTDGTEPTIQSTAYATEGFTLNETTTVKAIAVKAGDEWVNSDVATAQYTVNIPVYTVSFDAGNGTTTAEPMQGNVSSPIDLSNVTATPSTSCGGQGWEFAGWSTEAVQETTNEPTMVSNPFVPTQTTTLYAVYSKTETSGGSATPASYVKLTSAPNDWSGDYLIVYEDGNVAFNGGLATLDAESNTIGVTISEGSIESTITTDAAKFTIAAVTGGYSILSASEMYIGQTSDANGLASSATNVYTNTLSMDGNNVSIHSSGGAYLRYNSASNQARFRYYKSTSYTGQKAIQLYKYVAGTSGSTITYNSNPNCINSYVITAEANDATYGTVTGTVLEEGDFVSGTSYAENTGITLTAIANTGYSFVNWTKGGETVSYESTYTFTVTEDASFVANFSVNSYNITANVAPANSGSVEGAGSYTYGSTATLTATAATGYHFVNWTKDDVQVSTDAEYSFTVTGDATCVANFELNNYDITVSANPTEGGTVSGEGNFNYGDNVILTATANTGYTFVNWTKGGESVSTNPTCTLAVTGAAAYVANFELNSYEITVSADPTEGGTVSGAGNYNHGADVTLTATANEGYTFTNWTKSGEEVSTESTYSFAAEAAGDYVANFTLNSYEITATANPAAGGTVTGAGTYSHGANVTLTAMANEGYTFTNWTKSGEEVSTQSTYSFAAAAAGDYVANFTLNSYEITVSADPTEGGTVSGAGNYNHGADVTLTATANEGYTFVNWTKGGESVSTNPTCTLAVTGAAAYVAHFSLNSYAVTATVNPAEGGSVAGAGTYSHGANVTLIATANNGYHFVNWTENDAEVSTDASYSFTFTGARNLVANFAITPAELAWSAESFTGYTLIDFNNWKPTLTNSHNVSVRFGCVEGNVPTQGGVEVDATTGMIGGETGAGYIVHTPGTYHIYAVHDTDPTYYYDSVVYTLNVERGVIVALLKNIDEAGTAVFADYTTEPTLTHSYSGLVAIVAHGQTVRVQADPATGYHFNSWQVGDNVNGYTPVSTEATYTYTVPDIMSIGIKAVFDTNTYALNVVSANETMGIAAGSTTAKHFLNYEISATPNTGYHFTQWSDGNTQNPRTVTLTENTTYTAEFAINNYTVAASANPTNGGSIEGAGNYNHFANATLIATATNGYTFVNWTEGGQEVSTNATYSFQVTGARELVANFSLNTYAVSASANPAAGGTVTGAGTYNHGASVTVTATANEGYTFVNWTEGDQVVSTEASYTFTFTGARTLVANFTPIIYTVTFNAGTGSCQTASRTGSIESSIDIDAVTATPSTICGNQDWVFAGWSTASVAETDQAPAFVSGTEYYPSDNITLYAVYTKNVNGGLVSTTSSITFSEQGYQNGQAVSSVSIGNNINVNFSAGTNNNAPKYYTSGNAIRCYGGNYFTVSTNNNTPITSIKLGFGSGDGSNAITTNSPTYSNGTWTGNANSVKFTIGGTTGNRRIDTISVTTSDVSTVAIYNSNPVCYVYAVNVDQNIPHGSVTASQTTDIVAGTEITLTPAMDDGYHFGRWIVTAGNDPVTVEDNKFTMPESDVNVSALFWIDTLTVNVNANPAAGGTVTGAGDYEYGNTVTLEASAATGYTFVNWTESGVAVSDNATYTFTFDGDAGTKNFVANFSLNSYEISVSANPTAGGNVNGGNTYNYGATATLTANPSTGYHFVNWTKEGVVVSTDANYSFTVAEAGAYVANFELNSYTIAATANPTAGGTVTGAGIYNHFANVTLTATVNDGYDFDGWYNGNNRVATSLEYSFEATGDVTLEARFAKRYTITFVPGSHSSSTIEPRQGSSVNPIDIDAVTANPSTLCVAQDWVFAGWSSQAIAETNDAPTTWVSGAEYYPTSDITLYAVYKKTEGAGSTTSSITFSDLYNANTVVDGTSISINDNTNTTVVFAQENGNYAPQYYANGTSVRCYPKNTMTISSSQAITNIVFTFGSSDGSNTISVDEGNYSAGTWTGNENSVTFTIGGTNGNRRIAGMSVTTFSGTVTYNSDPECFVYDVVVNPDIEHGTVTADPNTGVIAGTEITLTNTPSEGYHFAGWTVTAGNDPVTVENNKFLMPESDVNVTATFEPDTFTLTINYSIVGGGDAPQSYSNRLPFGTPYSVNTPVIAGLTPSQEVVSGTMPAQDVTVNVTYSTVPYTLTIHYVYADNTPAANDVVRNLAYNVPYSETSPTIEGYTPDQAVVSGTMGEADLEVTVVYSINSHNLTVNYVNEASAQVAESHTATLNYHDNYSVFSPQVAGYAANKSVVSGTMGDADKTETVTYYLVETSIVDATNCAGTGTGSLTVTAPTGNFEYSLDGVTFQTETQFANLNAGDYTLYIRPTGEAYNYSGVWTVNSNITMPVAEASVNPFYCLGDEINLSGNGSSTGSEYTYAWSGPNNFTATDINATIAAAEDIHSGSYTLTVTNTVTNCVSDTTVDVIVNTPNMNGYLFTIATHGDAYANLVGGQATPVFATPTVQHYLADAGCTVTLSNDAQATYEEAGDYTITWTATDACGNTATTTQVLHIVLGTCPVAADVDGNTYPVVALNNICWMAANLRTTHYSDGRLIPNPMVYTSVMYPDATANLDMFGYLYDWTAAMDAANGLVQDANGNVQGICPDGWRMPKENEIRALVNDGVSDIFDLRTTDQWLNNFGTNTTGFSLLPAGCYNANSDRFENLHGDAYIWGVGASAPAQPRVFWADCKCYNWQILDTTTPMGYSVRCVRNN